MISARDESTKVLREPFFLLAGTIATDCISTIPRILERICGITFYYVTRVACNLPSSARRSPAEENEQTYASRKKAHIAAQEGSFSGKRVASDG